MKKKLNKIIGLFLAAVLILSLCSSVYAKEDIKKYRDVPRDSWYYDAVDFVSILGVMNGVGGETFAPHNTVSRAMFITMLYRLAGTPKIADKITQFKDVKADAYYANAVLWGKKHKIVFGVSSTLFAPEKDITREEMACMIVRYAESIQAPFLEDPDCFVEQMMVDEDVSVFAKDAMDTMVFKGLYRGDGSGYFYPRKTTTRAEAAMTMMRLAFLLEKIPSCATLKTEDEKSYTLSEKDTIWLFGMLHNNMWRPSEYAEYFPCYTVTIWGTEYRFHENASKYNGFNIVTASDEYFGAQGKDEDARLDLEVIFELLERYCSENA